MNNKKLLSAIRKETGTEHYPSLYTFRRYLNKANKSEESNGKD